MMNSDEISMMMDPTVVRIMKLRKRHVRLALERRAAEQAKARIPIACPTCQQPATANYDENHTYRGHHCEAGHSFIVARRVRDPNAPRPVIEKADPRGLPSGGNAPPPLPADTVKATLEGLKQIKNNIEKHVGTNWFTSAKL